jgi:hypothetical protein
MSPYPVSPGRGVLVVALLGRGRLLNFHSRVAPWASVATPNGEPTQPKDRLQRLCPGDIVRRLVQQPHVVEVQRLPLVDPGGPADTQREPGDQQPLVWSVSAALRVSG